MCGIEPSGTLSAVYLSYENIQSESGFSVHPARRNMQMYIKMYFTVIAKHTQEAVLDKYVLFHVQSHFALLCSEKTPFFSVELIRYLTKAFV